MFRPQNVFKCPIYHTYGIPTRICHVWGTGAWLPRVLTKWGSNPGIHPPVQHPPQPSSNPFIPTSAHPIPALSNSQKRNSRKKRRGAPMPATPVVPQPMGHSVPAPEALLKLPQNLDPVTQQLAPPGQKWILVADTTANKAQPASIQPTEPANSTVEAVKTEPEPEKSNVELKTPLYAAANKLQHIVESAIACLLEQRLRYPLNKIGILEAFVPQKKKRNSSNRHHHNCRHWVPEDPRTVILFPGPTVGKMLVYKVQQRRGITPLHRPV